MTASQSRTAEPRDGAPRLNITAASPDVYYALMGFTSAAEANLDETITKLVRIRASQMNGCGFCLGMHTTAARSAGETEARISELSRWNDSPLYTDKERAALALTEAVTFVADEHVSDEVYRAAAEHFDDVELAHLLWTIVAINAWNRIGIATRLSWG